MTSCSFSSLSIGRASDFQPRRLSPEVTNIAVRVEDQATFLAIIDARERQIERKVGRFVHPAEQSKCLTAVVADGAIGAAEALAANDRQLATSRLEATVAIAIAALNALKGES